MIRHSSADPGPTALAPVGPAASGITATYQRQMRLYGASRTVACQRCGAQPGNWCTSTGGYTTGTHAVRRAAAAGLTEEQILAAWDAIDARAATARTNP